MKIEKLRKKLKYDAAVFFDNDPNILYFTEHDLDGCILIIPKKRKPIILASSRDYDQVKSYKIKGFSILRNKKLKEIIKGHIQCNLDLLSVNTYNKLKKDFKISDISKACNELRMQKSAEEIKKIKKACSIVDSVMNIAIRNASKFKTEKELANFIFEENEKKNVKPSFSIISASGKNAAYPHHVPGNSKLKGFTIIDIGVRYKCYVSDITRTIYFGNPSKKDLEIYNKVLHAQEKAISLVKSGVNISKLDNAARKQLGSLEKYFIHSLGHGIGVEVHESPLINSKSKEKLKKGMVITIEPGVYIPGKMGIRIEDDVLVTEKGFEVLTKVGKDLVVVK